MFPDVHAAAIRVIAEHLDAWGLLPDGVTVEDTLDKEHGQYHRRWMVHGTSHHLGLDVHDCAQATREEYMDAVLEPGMVLTVEPGLYFKADDLLAPERFRGIGVRIEDDVLVTADGCENLSAAMPRRAGGRRGLDRPGPGALTVQGSRAPAAARATRADDVEQGGVVETPAGRRPPGSLEQLGAAAGTRRQGGVVGVMRLERVHGRLEVLARDVDEVGRTSPPATARAVTPPQGSRPSSVRSVWSQRFPASATASSVASPTARWSAWLTMPLANRSLQTPVTTSSGRVRRIARAMSRRSATPYSMAPSRWSPNSTTSTPTRRALSRSSASRTRPASSGCIVSMPASPRVRRK